VSVKVSWNSGPFERQVDQNAKKRLAQAAILAVATAKENMGSSPSKSKNPRDHISSPPGGYPFSDSGWMKQNITFEVDGMTARWGVLARTEGGKDLEYALHLETGTRHMAPRPWITLTINKCMSEWKQILVDGFGVERELDEPELRSPW